MKDYCVVSPEKGRVELQELQVQDPQPNQIQVGINVSLISPGTERAWILNLPNTPGKYPFQPGYCSTGVVEKVGTEVKGFNVGDRVYCSLPHQSRGNINTDRVIKIPDEVSFDKAVFSSLSQVALQGIRKTRIELGEKVMVIGLGVIGQLALQLARLSGALPAVGIDRVESRLQAALKCGADLVVDSSKENWMDEVGEKPHVVIELTGMPQPVLMSLEAVRQFGRVSLTGSSRGETTVNFYKHVHSKAVTVIGAHAYLGVPLYESSPGYWAWKDDISCIMGLLSNGRLNVEPLITNRVSWDQAEETYKQMIDWNTDMIGTIINWV